MITKIIKLKFLTPIHYGNFGKPGLDNTDIGFLSDTIYSAIIDENPHILDSLLAQIGNNELLISDTFPYVDDELLLCRANRRVTLSDGFDDKTVDRSIVKKLNKIKYLPVSKYNSIYKDGLKSKDVEEISRLNDNIGFYSIRTLNATPRGGDKPKPYTVGIFTFSEKSGLYFILKAINDKVLNDFVELIKSIGFVGIGGRRSSGLGKFEVSQEDPRDFFTKTKGNRSLLVSTFLPIKSTQRENIEITVIKRSGFYRDAKNTELYKKRDIFAIKSGMICETEISGQILDDLGRNGDKIYRVLMPLYIKVEL